MNMCQKHWDALKDEIKLLDLWQFVAKDGYEAANRMQEMFSPGKDPQKPDEPLIRVMMAITGKALEEFGARVFTERLCPLCEYDKHPHVGEEDGIAQDAQIHIETCCGAMHDLFIKNGWLKERPVQ